MFPCISIYLTLPHLDQLRYVLLFCISLYFIGANIEKARKNIEEAMESRRKCFEVAKIRRDQVASRFLKIRDEIDMKKQGGGWIDKASLELETLYKIHGK